MAAGTSSSRKKSSYTRKKKPTKNSSEVRRKSKSSKGNKSKKRGRHVSVSCSDEDSRTEDSVSFSSSDSEDYRRRRARSRTRGNIKGSKRVRRSSSGHKDKRESSHRKKKKGWKQNDGSEQRKKMHKRKRGNGRAQRDASVDSMSSDSLSCSTCRGGSSSGESEFERPRGRYEGREKGKTSSVKRSNGKHKYRHRSRSWSSCSERGNDSSYEGKERLTSENYSRRLRSVLTVAKEFEEAGRYQSKDENKAEIIQAYDDCPSCRSNDSYDGGRKKESSHHAHIVSEKRRVDDGRVEEAYTSKISTTRFTHSGKDDAITQCGENDPTRDVIELTKVENKSEVSIGVGNSGGDDLELLLRQKALENLRKFRGGLHTNMKAAGDEKGESDNGVNQPSNAKTESIRFESHKEAGSRFARTKQMVAKEMGYVGIPTIESKSATSSQNNGPITEGNYDRNESRVEVHAAHPVLGAGNLSSDQTAADKATEKSNTNTGAINTNSAKGTSTLRQESSGDLSILNKAPTSKDCPKGKFLETTNTPDKVVAETPNIAPRSDHTHGAEVNKTCGSAAPEASSCINPLTGGHGSNEPRNEAEGDSQFKQKTMSVMRGGEVVQVSYKVYIPKKPPALARRQLQR